MKFLLLFSILLVFFQVIEGNKTKEHDFHETNDVKDDYGQTKDGTSAVSSGDDIESTWLWEPKQSQKNKIKYEPALAFFNNSNDGSGFDNETEIQKDDPGTTQSDWSPHEVKNVKKTKGKAKTQSSVESSYLEHDIQLKKSNWCFKENKDSRHHKFKKTDVCCRKRKQCRKTRMAVRKGIYQCSCDVDFYRCLENSGTAMSKSIGQLYFNNNSVVCYRKRLVKPCTELPCSIQYKRKIIYHFPQ